MHKQTGAFTDTTDRRVYRQYRQGGIQTLQTREYTDTTNRGVYRHVWIFRIRHKGEGIYRHVWMFRIRHKGEGDIQTRWDIMN